jgi:hypothetical protein
MKSNVFVYGLLLFLFGCDSGNGNGERKTVVYVDREEFVTQVSLHDPEEIVFEDLLNPAAFYVMYDTPVVVQNQSNCDRLIEMYSLNGKTRIGQFAAKGAGPDDFISCSCRIYSGADSLICLIDEGKYAFSVVDVPRTLADGKLYFRQRFRYDPEIHPLSDICIVDDGHYIGYNMWHIDSREYSNRLPALKKYAMDEPDDSSAKEANMPDKYPWFVASVNDARLAVHPRRKEIWLLDGHRDKIDIYSADSLQIVKTISGPDGYRLSYTDVKSNGNIRFVTFRDEKTYRAYTNYTCTEKYIYIIYEGVNGGAFNPEDLQPVEVLKFDWDGNPVCDYKLDRFIYTISVDSREEYLYCTTRTSYKESAGFLKYKL